MSYLQYQVTKSHIFFLKVSQYARNIKTLPMYYLYPLNKLKICFQSESHTNITKSKQLRKFFVSPVKFTKVHVRGFVNEPTICNTKTLLFNINSYTQFEENR